MACTSFSDCLPSNPLPAGAQDTFGNLSRILIFSMNLVYYLLYAFFIVYVVYNLFISIYKLIFTKDEETFEVVRKGITGSVLGAVALVLLTGGRFLLVQVLRLIGIPDAENIFLDLSLIFNP